MPRLVDLSHPIEHGMITYPGLPGPVVSDFMGREASRGHYAEGTTFHIARVRMVGNTGTYLDAPFHRFAHGKDVGSLPLERLADLHPVPKLVLEYRSLVKLKNTYLDNLIVFTRPA